MSTQLGRLICSVQLLRILFISQLKNSCGRGPSLNLLVVVVFVSLRINAL